MNELWVARDVHGPIHLYEGRPAYRGGLWFSGPNNFGFLRTFNDDPFPDLKPGECRRLVMESEVSE